MKYYKLIIEHLNYLLFMLLVIVLPYPAYFARTAYTVWLISWLLELRWLHRPNLNRYGKDKRVWMPLIGIAIGYLWQILSVSWSIAPDVSWSTIGRLASIVVILPVLLYGVNERYQPRQILQTLVITCVSSVFVYLFVHYWVSNAYAAIDKFVSPGSSIQWGSLNDLTLDIKHRLYYSTWLSVALVGLIEVYPYWCRQHGKLNAITYTALSALVLVAGIYWTGSRQSIINIVVLGLAAAIMHMPAKHKIAAVTGLCTCIILGAVCVSQLHPRFKEHNLQQWFAYDESATEPATEPRIAIWKVTLENQSEYWATGTGVGTTCTYLTNKYAEKGWTDYVRHRYSTHNQILSEYVELGIAGAVFFLLLWLSTPLWFRGKAREWAIYLTLLMVLTMMTESILDRTEGIHLYTLSLLLIYQMALPVRESTDSSLTPIV